MKTYWILILWLVCGSSVKAQTSVQGTLVAESTGEPVLFASVDFYQNDVLKISVEIDKKGKFSIPNLDPGWYDIDIFEVGLATKRVESFLIKEGRINILYERLEDFLGCEIIVKEYQIPLIDFDLTSSGQHFTFKNKTIQIH